MSSWFSDQNGFFNHGSGDLFVNQSSICSNDEKVEFQNEQSYPDGSRGAGGSSGGIDSHSSGGYGSIERYGCGGGFANSSTGGGCLSYGESGYVARNFAQEGTGGGYADSSCGKGTPRIPKAINPRAVTGRTYTLQKPMNLGPKANALWANVPERDPKYMIASKALKFYKKNHQDGELEMVEALFYERLELGHPDWLRSEEWFHVSFTVKPKSNKSCATSKPIHFFAELQNGRGTYIVKSCYAFEPNHDHHPGFKHGCLICPTDDKFQKFHPRQDQCIVGFEPHYEALVFCG